MTKEDVLKLQTYKLFENDTELYVNRDEVLRLIETHEEHTDAFSKDTETHECDCISREKVLKGIEEIKKSPWYNEGQYSTFIHDIIRNMAIREAVDVIRDVVIRREPSVIPERKHGKWKVTYAESDGSRSWIEFDCPYCGGGFGLESGQYGWTYGDNVPWKACPNCGAEMEAEIDG